MVEVQDRLNYLTKKWNIFATHVAETRLFGGTRLCLLIGLSPRFHHVITTF